MTKKPTAKMKAAFEKTDKPIDKKMGTREGSPKDKAQDAMGMKKMFPPKKK